MKGKWDITCTELNIVSGHNKNSIMACNITILYLIADGRELSDSPNINSSSFSLHSGISQDKSSLPLPWQPSEFRRQQWYPVPPKEFSDSSQISYFFLQPVIIWYDLLREAFPVWVRSPCFCSHSTVHLSFKAWIAVAIFHFICVIIRVVFPIWLQATWG